MSRPVSLPPRVGSDEITVREPTQPPSSTPPCSRLLLLVGLPGSGKSTLARNLHLHSQRTRKQPIWHWVESDRSTLTQILTDVPCLLALGHRVVIDRCNLTLTERAQLVQAIGPLSAIDCVHFTTPPSTCLTRVWARRDHPTLPPSKLLSKGQPYIQRLLTDAHHRTQSPTLSEGYTALHLIDSPLDLQNLFTLLTDSTSPLLLDDNSRMPLSDHPPTSPFFPLTDGTAASPPPHRIPLAKFPRTPHIFDAGGRAVDVSDLLLSASDASTFVGPSAPPLVVQEKVDGANLGLTLLPDLSVVAHSRAHYVSASSHPQYANLPPWLTLHTPALIDLLSPPGRYTLYGEWCRAKHSIHYRALPDWFLAFDMWDAVERRWWGAGRLQGRLRGTGVRGVGVLGVRRYRTKRELVQELERVSQYRGDGGKVEGVVLRVETEDGQWLVQRGKLVRPDFVQGITEHWTKQSMVKNEVRHSGSEDEDDAGEATAVPPPRHQIPQVAATQPRERGRRRGRGR